MKKKIIALVMAFVSAFGLLSGCILTHNSERDMRQVIAVVHPITTEWTVSGQPQSYTHPQQNIIKMQLVNAYQNNGESYLNQGYTVEETFNELLRQLVGRHLILAEANALIKQGKLLVFNRGKDNEEVEYSLEESMTDMNTIWKNVYSVIDNQIFLYGNEILKRRGDPEVEKGQSQEAQTAFPALPDFDTAEPDDIIDTEIWIPNTTMGPRDDQYLNQAAFAEFMRDLPTSVEESLDTIVEETGLRGAARRAERRRLEALIESEKALIEDYLENRGANGELELYLKLRELNLFVVNKTIFEDQRDSHIVSRLLEYLADTTVISDAVIQSYRDDKLQEQKSNFDADFNAFVTALEGSEPVFYYPKDRRASEYFYVKHILIPFSDEQKAAIEAFNSADNGYTTAAQKLYRSRTAESISGKARTQGEEVGNALNYRTINAEVQSVMNGLTTLRDKDRAFTTLMYKYNTDTGAFNYPKGYLVKPESGQYMVEFEQAARDLFDKGVVGAVSEPALTDYGWHILYLAEIVEPGREFNVFHYQSAAQIRSQQYYEIIKELKRQEIENAAYGEFEKQKLDAHFNDEDAITYYTSRYKDLLAL